jgi:staphylococcal nuclease domain-containing protein 1
VIRHRDFEERSNFYDALLAAESRAIAGKKGIHSAKDPPVMHITDLTTVRTIIIVLKAISFFTAWS